VEGKLKITQMVQLHIPHDIITIEQ